MFFFFYKEDAKLSNKRYVFYEIKFEKHLLLNLNLLKQ